MHWALLLRWEAMELCRPAMVANPLKRPVGRQQSHSQAHTFQDRTQHSTLEERQFRAWGVTFQGEFMRPSKDLVAGRPDISALAAS